MTTLNARPPRSLGEALGLNFAAAFAVESAEVYSLRSVTQGKLRIDIVAMRGETHVILNALANTGAGTFNVARNLASHLAAARRNWRFTLLLADSPLHNQITSDALPPSVAIRRAPQQAQGRIGRLKFERTFWSDITRQQHVSAAVQLNGFMPPGAEVPVLAHEQDPWPYLPEAWDLEMKDRVLAFMRRRGHRIALRQADFVGFTSNYLRDLMTSKLGISPKASAVFYNGLPQEWIDRAANLDATSIPLHDRPMEIITVSGVGKYKRQELVIRALPQLIAKPGLSDLIYRVIGKIAPAEYEQHLKKLAMELGISDHVVLEGRASDDRVREALGRARCFVLMSVAESFGIPAIEAMSLGTPVVTSNCCAMPEVCGNAAVLSPVDDLPALVDNIHRVLRDEPFAQQLRAAGATNCQRFQWSQTAEQMAKALEQMIRD